MKIIGDEKIKKFRLTSFKFLLVLITFCLQQTISFESTVDRPFFFKLEEKSEQKLGKAERSCKEGEDFTIN